MKENRTYASLDVADLAKVSQANMSRIFAGSANVSKQKKERILAAAEKLNYHPNALASSLNSKRARTIDIILRNVRNPFYCATLEIFYNRLSEIGYHLLFLSSENEEVQDREIAELLQYNGKGVVITDALPSSSAAQKLSKTRISVILLHRYTSTLTNSAVFCDNYSAPLGSIGELHI